MRLASFVFAVAAALVPSRALAHPAIDEARELLQRAEFDEALAALERAAQAENLAFADAVELFELRALAHVALADVSALAQDMKALASIAPDHRFAPEAPPELQGMLEEEARRTPRLSVVAEASPTVTGLRIDARVADDTAEVVRSLSLYARSERDVWRRIEPGDVVPLEETLYYAEAIGPGEAVVATAGSYDEPLVFDPDPDGDDEESDGLPVAAYVGIGAGVAIGALVAILLIAGSSGGTQPTPPVVLGF